MKKFRKNTVWWRNTCCLCPGNREHLRTHYPDLKFPRDIEKDLIRRIEEANDIQGKKHGDAMQRLAGEIARSLAEWNLDERDVRLYRSENMDIPDRWGTTYLLDKGLTAQVSRTRRKAPLWDCKVPERYREPNGWSSGETTVATRLATSCNRLGIRLYEKRQK